VVDIGVEAKETGYRQTDRPVMPQTHQCRTDSCTGRLANHLLISIGRIGTDGQDV